MSRNFKLEKNKKAARSNAISLQSKHKYLPAIAFWILADNNNEAINVCIQNLDDLHLAILISRYIWSDINNKEHQINIDKMMNNKILPFVQGKFHYNVWKQHMLLWLLKKPEESVKVFLDERKIKISDAPEVYSFVSYLKDNEIVKSIQKNEEQNKQIQIIIIVIIIQLQYFHHHYLI